MLGDDRSKPIIARGGLFTLSRIGCQSQVAAVWACGAWAFDHNRPLGRHHAVVVGRKKVRLTALTPKQTQQIVAALSALLVAKSPVAWFTSRTATGLFPHSPAGKALAQAVRQLQLVTWTDDAVLGLTTAGVRFLMDHGPVGSLLQLLQRRRQLEQPPSAYLEWMVTQVMAVLQTWQMTLAGHSAPASTSPAPAADWQAQALKVLLERGQTRPQEDCPLPELYRQLQAQFPTLSPGMFHDGLRALAQAGRIQVYPWTGPLNEMPEPGFALMTGHAIGYYVGLRRAA